MSEFRQDLVSGDWVLIAPERAKRSEAPKKEDPYQPPNGCPFEDLKKSDNEVLWYSPEESNWQIAVVKNKFPALKSGVCAPGGKTGPFNTYDGVGAHDLFVFRDHDKQLADFSNSEMLAVVRAYKKHFKEVADQNCGKYTMIFNNYGKESGASLYHPHTQIMAMPILPPHVSRLLYGAKRFYQDNNKKVFNVMIDWEKSEKKRIIYENELFVAFCPFASRFPYQILIFPKVGDAHFDQITEEGEKCFAEAVSAVLKKIKTALDDPSYNFFIHTSPAKDVLPEIHEFYSWHMEILPKFSISGGFEIGTGIDINVVDPDVAAEALRNA